MIIKFNPGGARADGVRPPARNRPTAPSRGSTRTRRCRRRTGCFRQPTDVAWDSQGNIYITDGYVNSRVAKYDRNGDWVKSWGDPGTGPGQFRTPHAIAIDRNDNVYVGDRGNQRIQVFDTDGKFLRMFKIEIPPAPGTRRSTGRRRRPAAWTASARRTRSASRRDRTQVMFVGEAPGRGGSSRSRSTARCSG